MRHRSRIPLALIALLTLLVSTTGTLWASTCTPETEGAPAAAEPPAPAPHAMPGCAGEEPAGAPAPEHRDSAPGQPPCPLLALGSAGACVPASLPSRAALQADLPGEREALAASIESAPDLLFSAPPFHPPRP